MFSSKTVFFFAQQNVCCLVCRFVKEAFFQLYSQFDLNMGTYNLKIDDPNSLVFKTSIRLTMSINMCAVRCHIKVCRALWILFGFQKVLVWYSLLILQYLSVYIYPQM